ncbi:hypothetical protein C0J52_00190 [Blattella germanica]|nr:hypothetical protein C0J52_00190 [Blattella germanica]
MPLEVKCISVRENFSCCCCNCTVKTGTILIGWLQLGIPMLALPYLLLGLIALAAMCLVVFKGITHLILSPREIANLFGNMVLSLLVTVQLAVRLSIETLLLYGAYREKPMFLLPYVVLDPVGVLWVASLILLIAIHLAGQVIIAYVAVLIIDSLLFGVRSYMWVIVYSYYRQLVRNVMPHTEIPLQNMCEAQPMVSPMEDQQPEKLCEKEEIEEDEQPVSAPAKKNPADLWPSSREYLL